MESSKSNVSDLTEQSSETKNQKPLMRDDLIPVQGKAIIRTIVDSIIDSDDDANIFIKGISKKKYSQEQRRVELEKSVLDMRNIIYQVGTDAYVAHIVSRSKYLKATKTAGSSIMAGDVDQVLGHIYRISSSAVSFLRLVGQILLIPFTLTHMWIDKARVEFEKLQCVTLASGWGIKDNFHKTVRRCVVDKTMKSINGLFRKNFGGHCFLKNPTKGPKKEKISDETCSSVDGCYDEGNGEGLGAPMKVTISGHPTEDPHGYTMELWLRMEKGRIAEPGQHPKEDLHLGDTMDVFWGKGGIPDDQGEGEEKILTVLSGLVKQASRFGVDVHRIQEMINDTFKGAYTTEASPQKCQCFIACDRVFDYLHASVSFYLTTDFHCSLCLTQKRTHLLCVHSYRPDQS